MRTKTPAQHEAEFRWLRPAQVAPMIGVSSANDVRDLIRAGHLKAINVSRSSRPSYRVSPEAIEAFIEESARRVPAA